MSAPQRPDGELDWRGEPLAIREDRNLAELLQELRVAGLGVQVLFGFLLSLPFTSRFERLGSAQRDLYVAAVALAAVAIALLVGPVAYHRLVFRRHQKEYLIRAANVMAICGLVTVALAISAAVLLVLSYVVPGVAAAVISTFVVILFAGLWVALPLARRQRRSRPSQDLTGNDRHDRLPAPKALVACIGEAAPPSRRGGGCVITRTVTRQVEDKPEHARLSAAPAVPGTDHGDCGTMTRWRIGEPHGRLGRWSGRAEGSVAVTRVARDRRFPPPRES